mmetsp:Transcript_1364/g.1791  ORF Transcript_1364/g.1791 Transcript_1364/m.1791 type:complete len:97 (+) Transcript_1364:429-719(+)
MGQAEQQEEPGTTRKVQNEQQKEHDRAPEVLVEVSDRTAEVMGLELGLETGKEPAMGPEQQLDGYADRLQQWPPVVKRICHGATLGEAEKRPNRVG